MSDGYISVLEQDYAPALYNTLRAVVGVLAAEGDKLTLQCSTRTFNDHLQAPELVAGPWAWIIKDEVPYGDVYLYRAKATDTGERGARFGTFTVRDGVIAH